MIFLYLILVLGLLAVYGSFRAAEVLTDKILTWYSFLPPFISCFLIWEK